MPIVKSKNAEFLDYGVSLSIKQCRNFGLDHVEVLGWLISKGFKRFRLMSYWDECEPEPGKYNFEYLDKQLEIIQESKGIVSLCLGVRQPRWPENHWPDWAWQLPKNERDESLLNYIKIVVNRYKNNLSVISYQLENEALLKNFGERVEIDRNRLSAEYKLIKSINKSMPIVMTTSTSWGIPFRQPIPDIIGFSYYQVLFSQKNNKYTTAFHNPVLDRLRALLIKIIWNKKSFIHELQLEPWGPKNIWEMSIEEQNKSMSPKQIVKNIALTNKTKLTPIDLWGAEWWYFRHNVQNDQSVWKAVEKGLKQ